jgi:hypothetical protein
MVRINNEFPVTKNSMSYRVGSTVMTPRISSFHCCHCQSRFKDFWDLLLAHTSFRCNLSQEGVREMLL